jgi:catechol 2,3-dioxygenase-like lactoylglutathione lyase family enzyme
VSPQRLAQLKHDLAAIMIRVICATGPVRWFILGEGKRRAFVMFAAQSWRRFLMSRSLLFVITLSDAGRVELWRRGASGLLRKADGRRTGSAAAGRTSYHPVMKTSGITAALPAQDLARAKAFYVEKVGLRALESGFLQARNGRVGLTVGDGVSQLFVYPARARSSGEFTQAVIHVTDVRRRRRDEGSRRGVRGVRHAGDADRERRCPDAGWR